MLINVGTKNPAKLEAAREVIQDYDFLKNAEVRAIEVSSGVSAQPLFLEEIVVGAMNRAFKAFQDCEYSFGLESGIYPFPAAQSGYMNTCVAAIYDGKRPYVAHSQGFEYPKGIIDLVLDEGIDISEAYKRLDLTDHDYIGHDIGAVGLLTKGRITRKDLAKSALQMALIQLDK